MQQLLTLYVLPPLVNLIVDYTIDTKEIEQLKQQMRRDLAPLGILEETSIPYIICDGYGNAVEMTINEAIDSIPTDYLDKVASLIHREVDKAGLCCIIKSCFGCNVNRFIGICERPLEWSSSIYYFLNIMDCEEVEDRSDNISFLCLHCQPLYCGCGPKAWVSRQRTCRVCKEDKCITHAYSPNRYHTCTDCLEIMAYGKSVKLIMKDPALHIKYQEAMQYIITQSQLPK